jgi:uncharacterized membrane protein (DUF373 family)
MDNNIDFKNLWHKQPIAEADKDQLFVSLNEMRRRGMRKVILTNILFILTTVFICLIWYYYDPQLLSTKCGILLIIVAMFIYLMAYNTIVPSFNAMRTEKSNAEYLQHLVTIRKKQKFLYSTMLNLYFILLSTGLFLYMYEPSIRMTLRGKLIAYGLTLAWVLFNWIYVRPRTIKKQSSKINELIEKFENINEQLKPEGPSS